MRLLHNNNIIVVGGDYHEITSRSSLFAYSQRVFWNPLSTLKRFLLVQIHGFSMKEVKNVVKCVDKENLLGKMISPIVGVAK